MDSTIRSLHQFQFTQDFGTVSKQFEFGGWFIEDQIHDWRIAIFDPNSRERFILRLRRVVLPRRQRFPRVRPDRIPSWIQPTYLLPPFLDQNDAIQNLRATDDPNRFSHGREGGRELKEALRKRGMDTHELEPFALLHYATVQPGETVEAWTEARGLKLREMAGERRAFLNRISRECNEPISPQLGRSLAAQVRWEMRYAVGDRDWLTDATLDSPRDASEARELGELTTRAEWHSPDYGTVWTKDGDGILSKVKATAAQAAIFNALDKAPQKTLSIREVGTAALQGRQASAFRLNDYFKGSEGKKLLKLLRRENGWVILLPPW